MSIIKKIPAIITSTSLVCIRGNQLPVSRGNYFWLKDDTYGQDGIRILNMWAENLRHATQLFLSDGKVQVRVYVEDKSSDIAVFGIIDDERIPKDYYYNKLCTTGYYSPSVNIARQIFDCLGDPENELEQYENPVKYWSDRGWDYYPEKGIRTKRKSNAL